MTMFGLAPDFMYSVRKLPFKRPFSLRAPVAGGAGTLLLQHLFARLCATE